MDYLALLGALTGTTGATVALRREYLASRRRLAVAPGVNFTISRVEPVGSISHAWACVMFWNTGGRSLAVERVGFQYLAVERETADLRVMRAMILVDAPIEAAVDGPSRKVYTPLGPMLAAGINPFDVLEGVAITTGGREWISPPSPLIQSIPSSVSHDQLGNGLNRLRNEAETPPATGNEIGLLEEEPFLVGESWQGSADPGSRPV